MAPTSGTNTTFANTTFDRLTAMRPIKFFDEAGAPGRHPARHHDRVFGRSKRRIGRLRVCETVTRNRSFAGAG
jgi:hypothetical protein